ncbi:MAG: prepilin peptidase [Chloroflexi bacterium]|nr:MAG: prepilin peptidase [Chloroflexota bacterium]TME14727.1 MAG: prepilin peptidase [Chloroflexota bacterium]TME15157.1 MAG: prepilin peptidase [Chloroflexota bacterium]
MQTVVPFVIAYLILVGLFLGSFINLAADRIPRGESVVRPASHCRTCGRRLNWVDLLPVAGYLIRGGRCASCRTPIGLAAPVIEATSGLLLAIPLVWLGLLWGALAGIALVALWGAAVVAYAVRRGVSA